MPNIVDVEDFGKNIQISVSYGKSENYHELTSATTIVLSKALARKLVAKLYDVMVKGEKASVLEVPRHGTSIRL